MTIHIYYRHTAVRRLRPQKRPEWFSYAGAMANLLNSSRNALVTGQVILNVVYDGAVEEFEQDEVFAEIEAFRAQVALPDTAIRIHSIAGGDQRKAWKACLSIVDALENSPGDDLIYFLENDYIHVPDWLEKIAELQASGIRWDYLTLYDHPDKYPEICPSPDAQRYTDLKSRVFSTGSHHWRTTPSTCATYLTRVQTYLADRAILKLALYDFKLFKLLTSLKRRRLLSPIPSLSTHSMSEFMAPAIDWEAVTRGGDA